MRPSSIIDNSWYSRTYHVLHFIVYMYMVHHYWRRGSTTQPPTSSAPSATHKPPIHIVLVSYLQLRHAQELKASRNPRVPALQTGSPRAPSAVASSRQAIERTHHSNRDGSRDNTFFPLAKRSLACCLQVVRTRARLRIHWRCVVCVSVCVRFRDKLRCGAIDARVRMRVGAV